MGLKDNDGVHYLNFGLIYAHITLHCWASHGRPFRLCSMDCPCYCLQQGKVAPHRSPCNVLLVNYRLAPYCTHKHPNLAKYWHPQNHHSSLNAELIITAIASLADPTGSSQPAIEKWLMINQAKTNWTRAMLRSEPRSDKRSIRTTSLCLKARKPSDAIFKGL